MHIINIENDNIFGIEIAQYSLKNEIGGAK